MHVSVPFRNAACTVAMVVSTSGILGLPLVQPVWIDLAVSFWE